jgi:hypothetical protein
MAAKSKRLPIVDAIRNLQALLGGLNGVVVAGVLPARDEREDHHG